MKEIDWLVMLENQQELNHFSRTLINKSQNKTLTNCERELLARIYLEPEESTPLALSKLSGMKKESVSRSLKNLSEKNFIQKKKNPQDDRSYTLSLTDAGREELKQNYGAILQPLYDLRRSMGDDFDILFKLIKDANKLMNIKTYNNNDKEDYN